MKSTILGFLICQICMYFIIVGEGTFYTVCAYTFWIGIFLVVVGLFSDNSNK